MSNYYYYTTNDDGTDYIGIVDDDKANYAGTAKVFYSKLEDLDTTTDTNSPTINERYHWFIVWGALYLMGVPGLSEQAYAMYRQGVQASKSAGRKIGTLTTWTY